jgi:hypothetical protein
LNVSCYANYVGKYRIPADRAIKLENADEQIYEAIRDLGFERRSEYLLKPRQALPLNGLRLEGDDTAVRVTMWGNPLQGIRVIDTSKWRETDFTREVKRRIEKCLRDNYGLENLEFHREPQLVPNS